MSVPKRSPSLAIQVGHNICTTRRGVVQRFASQLACQVVAQSFGPQLVTATAVAPHLLLDILELPFGTRMACEPAAQAHYVQSIFAGDHPAADMKSLHTPCCSGVTYSVQVRTPMHACMTAHI